MKHNTMTIIGLAAGIALCTASGFAGANPNPRILPPNSSPSGASYDAWAVEVNQWFCFCDPIIPTPARVSGNVVVPPITFLATGTQVLPLTLQPGQLLFVPICFAGWVNAPGDPGYGVSWDVPFTDPDTGIEYSSYEQWVRELLKAYLDPVNPSCCIDGQPVKSIDLYRMQTSLFEAELSANNLMGLPPGKYSPCVADGWYVMLTPFKPGKHTVSLTIGDTVIRYEITVSHR